MDGEDAYTSLCRLTGHLFLRFAALETALSVMLRMHLSDNIGDTEKPDGLRLASAIYGGLRYSAARDHIKRIMEVESTGAVEKAFVSSAFQHISHIQNLRDQLAHRHVNGAYTGGSGMWQLVDFATSKDISKPQVHLFHIGSVFYAAEDLTTAMERLCSYNPGTGCLFPTGAFDTSPIPWRYKSSMLKLVPLDTLRSAQ